MTKTEMIALLKQNNGLLHMLWDLLADSEHEDAVRGDINGQLAANTKALTALQGVATPTKKSKNPFSDSVPDTEREGWWVDNLPNGRVVRSTMFTSAAEWLKDHNRREKLRKRYNSEEREKKARDWLPIYLANLSEARELERIIKEDYKRREDAQVALKELKARVFGKDLSRRS